MPFLIIADIATFLGLGVGAIGGSVITYCSENPGNGCLQSRDVHMRQLAERGDHRVGPCNVPAYNFVQCHEQLKSQSTRVMSSIPSTGVAQFDNIPSACMDLGATLIGACGGSGPRPEPCGSACMKYIGLSDAQMRQLSASLDAK
ncbi:hypothetical protein ACHAQJ_001066 [Trichoderma viride]